MSKEIFIDNIKKLIALGETHNAIVGVMKTVKDKDKVLYDTAILQMSRFSSLKKGLAIGELSYAEAERNKSQINNAVLYLLDEISNSLIAFEFECHEADLTISLIENEDDFNTEPSKVISMAQSLDITDIVSEIPGDNIGLSPAYITRKGEDNFIRSVLRPGVVLRIKGPRKFGLNSLMTRVIRFAETTKYIIVNLDFHIISLENLNDLNNLLIQFCSFSSLATGRPNKISEFWSNEFLDVKMKASLYIEDLLKSIDSPVLFALEKTDRLFEFSNVSSDFFGLLRYWHEQARRHKIWENFRLAISYSTEAYLAINDLNRSPFNVGEEFHLHEFSEEEVRQFISMHGLNLPQHQIDILMKMYGGQPYLVHIALNNLSNKKYTFDELIKKSSLESGPFTKHMKIIMENIFNNEKLSALVKTIIKNNYANDTQNIDKLRAAGLVTGEIPDIKISCELYKQYLEKRL